MVWFSNLKIRSKMTVGFGTLIILMIFVAGFSLVRMRNIEDSFTYAIRHPIHGEIRILEFSDYVREFRRIAATITAFSHLNDMHLIDNYHQNALTAYNAGIQALNYFDAGMRIDPRVPQELIDAVLADTGEKRRLFHEYLTTVYNPLVEAARTGNVDAAVSYLMSGGYIAYALADSIADLLELASFVATQEVEDAIQVADRTFKLLIFFAAAITLVSVALALLVSAVTVKPILKLRTVVSEVSAGKMNINLDRSNIPNDEIGMLTRDMCGLVDVIKNIVDDLTEMEHEIDVVGDFEYRVNTDKYQNAFKEMIEGVHAIIDNEMEDIFAVLGVVEQIGDGDFKAGIKEMPGKKAVMPQILRTVTTTLESVSAEINEMIEAMNRGDLTFQIDTSKYKGDWREKMTALNHVVKAIDAPIIEINSVMESLSKGGFDKK